MLQRALNHRLFFPMLFIALCGAAYLLGYRMEVRYWYFQLLDRSLLETRLAESLFYLHAQPPLLNLLLGLALKWQQATGIAPNVTLLLLHILLGAGAIFFLDGISRALLSPGLLRGLLLGLLVCNPALYVFVFLYFYTLQELFLISLMLWAALQTVKSGRKAPLALLCLALVGLVYLRSAFHPLWAIIILSLVLLQLARSRRFAFDRRAGFIVATTALMLLIWPAKNYLLFEVAGYSSWQGYNLAQGLPASLVPAGTLYEPERDGSDEIPAQFQSIPALAQPFKQGGVVNWNHYPIIAYSSAAQAQALAAIRAQPGLLLQKAANNYLDGYALFAARNPYYDTLEATGSALHPAAYRWLQLYELLVFQRFPGAPTTGFALLVPLILGLSAFKLTRRWHTDGSETVIVWLMLISIVWVLLLVLFVDGVEGNRIRFPTEPLLMMLAAWLFSQRSARSAA